MMFAMDLSRIRDNKTSAKILSSTLSKNQTLYIEVYPEAEYDVTRVKQEKQQEDILKLFNRFTSQKSTKYHILLSL